MKTIDELQRLALGENLTYICRIFTITRVDGEVFRFTDHDRPVFHAGHWYSRDTSFEASAVQTAMNTAASDVDVSLILQPGTIEYMHVQRGLYDEAPVTLSVVNWMKPTLPALVIFEGKVGPMDLPTQHLATLRLTGELSKVDRDMTERYSVKCRAIFGDDRCKFPLETVTTDFTVTVLGGPQDFTSAQLAGKPVAEWILGTVLWTSGPNKGTRQEVANNNELGRVQLLFRPPFPMDEGHTGRITKGCPHTLAACIGYSNKPNYRGEPYVPGDTNRAG